MTAAVQCIASNEKISKNPLIPEIPSTIPLMHQLRRVLCLPLLGYFRNCVMVVSRINCTLKAYLTN